MGGWTDGGDLREGHIVLLPPALLLLCVGFTLGPMPPWPSRGESVSQIQDNAVEKTGIRKGFLEEVTGLTLVGGRYRLLSQMLAMT